MKMIVTTLCILLLIIGFAIGYQAYLEDTMKKYIAVVEEMDRSMDLGDYEAAKDEYDQTSYKLKLYFRHLIEKNRLNLETIL